LLRDFRETWVWIFPGAFWFVPLIVELYLCYPVITWGLRRFGGRALVACAVVTLLYRALAAWGLGGGPVGTDGYQNNVPMMFFPARLFEFALGIALARTGFVQRNERSAGRHAVFVVIGLALWAIGTTAASRKSGYFVSDPLIGAGLFFVIYEVSRFLSAISFIGSVIAFLGRKSYSIYLVHSVLIPSPVAFQPGRSFFGHLAVYVALSVGLAIVLDALVSALGKFMTSLRGSAVNQRGGA
jgi:peptidoglycan/LPS O-acetylase OafA/YrhL